MANALTDIQQALETIRIASEKADWQRKLDILLLMLSTSESFIAHALELTEPERKQVNQTNVVLKTQVVKRYVNMPSLNTKTATHTGQTQPGTDTPGTQKR